MSRIDELEAEARQILAEVRERNFENIPASLLSLADEVLAASNARAQSGMDSSQDGRLNKKDCAVAVSVARAERIAQLQAEIAAHLAEDDRVLENANYKVVVIPATEDPIFTMHHVAQVHRDQVRKAVLAMQEACKQAILNADMKTFDQDYIQIEFAEEIGAISIGDIINQAKP